MKKPCARLQRHLESRKKKQLARKQKLEELTRVKNLEMVADQPSGLAPRCIRRRKLLSGLTYWRGAREVLQNH